MPYVAVNLPNDYNPDNKTRFTTLEQSDQGIQAGLRQFPSHRFVTAEFLEEFTAEVVITGSEPVKPDLAPDVRIQALAQRLTIPLARCGISLPVELFTKAPHAQVVVPLTSYRFETLAYRLATS